MKRVLIGMGVMVAVAGAGVHERLMAAGGGGGAPAATRPAEQAYDSDAVLAPYVDRGTILIGHFDAVRMDWPGFFKFARGTMEEMKSAPGMTDASRKAIDDQIGEFDTFRTGADVILARFKQLGGRHVFLLVDEADVQAMLSGQFPLAVLFPVEPGGKAKELAALFDDGPQKASVLHDDMVFYGDEAPRARLAARLQGKRDGAPALSLGRIAPDAPPLQMVANFTADERRALAELMPRLPTEFGGGSTEALLRDFSMIRVKGTMTAGPAMETSIEMRKDDAAGGGAQGLLPVADILRDRLLAENWLQLPENAGLMAITREALSAQVRHEASADALVFQLKPDEIKRLITLQMNDQLHATLAAKHAAAAANIYRVLEACDAYVKAHNGTFPQSLDVLVQEKLLKPEEISDPTDPAHRQFGFHAWDAKVLGGPDVVPVVWEPQDDTHVGGYVGMMRLPLAMRAQWTDSRADEEALVKKAEAQAKTPQTRP